MNSLLSQIVVFSSILFFVSCSKPPDIKGKITPSIVNLNNAVYGVVISKRHLFCSDFHNSYKNVREGSTVSLGKSRYILIKKIGNKSFILESENLLENECKFSSVVQDGSYCLAWIKPKPGPDATWTSKMLEVKTEKHMKEGRIFKFKENINADFVFNDRGELAGCSKNIRDEKGYSVDITVPFDSKIVKIIEKAIESTAWDDAGNKKIFAIDSDYKINAVNREDNTALLAALFPKQFFSYVLNYRTLEYKKYQHSKKGRMINTAKNTGIFLSGSITLGYKLSRYDLSKDDHKMDELEFIGRPNFSEDQCFMLVSPGKKNKDKTMRLYDLINFKLIGSFDASESKLASYSIIRCTWVRNLKAFKFQINSQPYYFKTDGSVIKAANPPETVEYTADNFKFSPDSRYKVNFISNYKHPNEKHYIVVEDTVTKNVGLVRLKGDFRRIGFASDNELLVFSKLGMTLREFDFKTRKGFDAGPFSKNEFEDFVKTRNF